MKRVFLGMMALAIAAVTVVSTSSFKSKSLATVYWYHVTSANADCSQTSINLSESPFIGDENSNVNGCDNQVEECCAKGFTTIPTSPNQSTTLLRYRSEQ